MIDVHLNTIVVRDGLRPSCIVERSEGFTYGWWEQQRETKHLQSRNQQLARFIFDWCSFRSRLLPQGQQFVFAVVTKIRPESHINVRWLHCVLKASLSGTNISNALNESADKQVCW